MTDDPMQPVAKVNDPSIEARLDVEHQVEDVFDPTVSLRDPFRVALGFMSALVEEQELDDAQELLEVLVTPESREAWGDYSAARAITAGIEQWGMPSRPRPVPDAVDVVYVPVLAGVGEAYRSTAEQVVETAATFTLVWRPEYERWLVHWFGQAIPLEFVPRTSPNEGP